MFYYIKIGIGWDSDVRNVKYSQNSLQRDDDGVTKAKKRYFYTLEWDYQYEYANDRVYFAQFQPFTYSDLLKFLKGIKENHVESNIVRINTLCKTLAKNPCPVITITSNVDTYLPHNCESILSGKTVTSRRMILNRVQKLRTRLIRQRETARSRFIKNKAKTRDDIGEIGETEEGTMPIDSEKIGDLCDFQLAKEQSMECKQILLIDSL